VVRTSQPALRGAGFAIAAVTVSLCGHLATGGGIPDQAMLLLALVSTGLAYRWLLAGGKGPGRRWR
jgi:hypothetical protein